LLLLAILLLLSAVALLGAALVVGQIALAWASVGVSTGAAVVVLGWRRRSRRRGDAGRAEALASTAEAAAADDAVAPEQGAELPSPVRKGAERRVDPLIGPGRGGPGAVTAAAGDGEPVEPGEEDTDAAVLRAVLELSDEVLVVDEHPRYHLTRCRWPDPARAERLPVREARELGFTPCNRCRPDVEMVRRHQAAKPAEPGVGSVRPRAGPP
jgi:hypothetical protein